MKNPFGGDGGNLGEASGKFKALKKKIDPAEQASLRRIKISYQDVIDTLTRSGVDSGIVNKVKQAVAQVQAGAELDVKRYYAALRAETESQATLAAEAAMPV